MRKLKRITDDCNELDKYLIMLRDDCDRIEAIFPELAVINDEFIDRDINDVIKAIRLEIVASGDKETSAIENLIWEFKQELTNSLNVDQVNTLLFKK